MSWSMTSNAAERSRRQIQDSLCETMAFMDDHECTAEQFQWSGVYNRLTGEDVDFLRRGNIVDSLGMGWKAPELKDRMTMLVIVGMSTEDFFRSQVGIGSESDCLFGQSNRIL